MLDLIAEDAPGFIQGKSRAETQDSSREGAKALRKARIAKAGSCRGAEAQRKAKAVYGSREAAKARRAVSGTRSRSLGKRSAPGISARVCRGPRMRDARLSGRQNHFRLLFFSAPPRLRGKLPLTCFSFLPFAPLRLRESYLEFLPLPLPLPFYQVARDR